MTTEDRKRLKVHKVTGSDKSSLLGVELTVDGREPVPGGDNRKWFGINVEPDPDGMISLDTLASVVRALLFKIEKFIENGEPIGEPNEDSEPCEQIKLISKGNIRRLVALQIPNIHSLNRDPLVLSDDGSGVIANEEIKKQWPDLPFRF